MKKTGRLVLILELVLILLPCAARGASKAEYKTAMDDALRSMEDAFSSGEESAAVAATSAALALGRNELMFLLKSQEPEGKVLDLMMLIIRAHAAWRSPRPRALIPVRCPTACREWTAETDMFIQSQAEAKYSSPL